MAFAYLFLVVLVCNKVNLRVSFKYTIVHEQYFFVLCELLKK